MLRYFLLFILFVHGLIHLLGFLKAFQISEISQLTKMISKPEGLLWLITTILFLVTALLFLLGNGSWTVWAFVAILLSQVLIFTSWQDAKFGTIANILVLLAAILNYGARQFENNFRQDAQEKIRRTHAMGSEVLTEEDLQSLPPPVQQYLRYTGAVGKPKVKNMRLVFKGEMRSKTQDWFAFTSEQYNFYDEPTRLFFMKAKVKGLPTYGYHKYENGNARMLIKVLSLFSMVNLDGEQMFKAETVTVFNDMCLLAPATLIDSRIRWEAIDDTSAKAVFTNRGVSISAVLYFNEKGQLVDFVSDDRLEVSEMKQYRFSTPVKGYQLIHGRPAIEQGDGVWHYPDGDFVYGKFYLQDVEYNVGKVKE